MTTIAEARTTSTAQPAAFFARWADTATWPEWNTDTEWVRLDGPFTAGATGVLKPRGGPRVPFTVDTLVPDREFTDVSRLLGARLTFRHHVERTTQGGTTVRVEVTLTGPLARLWYAALGKGIRASLQDDLDRLAAAAEADTAAGAAAGPTGPDAPRTRSAQEVQEVQEASAAR
ncbi:hypothetical protein KNE206_60050 [Kitasatospora sp. NE20-6]|uniref:SRPBCC family protein n=1 Tax=Kitasatospora sp. NE20-6 TaxID=2859066 RepID=UPI0034DB9170